MRKIVYHTFLAALAFVAWGCYEDKGNYDYTDIGDVSLDIESGVYAYRVMLGDRLAIPATVTAENPGQALEYAWEVAVQGAFSEFAEGRDLDHIMGPDEHFPTYGEYKIRLKAVRTIDGLAAEAYSPVVTVTVSGESGLMVLHGDDTQSDIGVIQDPDFILEAGTRIDERVIYDNYSASNGAKIPGKGMIAVQHHTGAAATSHVYVVTDRTALFAAAAGLVREGGYADLFMSLDGTEPLYQGKPEAFGFYGSYRAVIDGGDLFTMGNASPKFSIRTEFIGMADYKASEYSYLDTRGYIFDMLSRRFFSASIQGGTSTPVTSYHSTKGPFNVNDMQADLLFFDRGGASGHFMGVFKKDDGGIFLGEINFDAKDDATGTYAHARYSPDNLAEFASARFHAFGSNASMCYYATAGSVYQYAVLGGSGTTTAMKLMTGAEPVALTGEVTMMKILAPRVAGGGTYQYQDRMLIVATYENGAGTLHAFVLDPLSGSALTHKQFTGFGRIADANLKTM